MHSSVMKAGSKISIFLQILMSLPPNYIIYTLIHIVKHCLSTFQVELIPYLSILVMNIIIMMKLSAANQFRRSFYQSGRQNSNNTEEMELQDVLPEQNADNILEPDLNSNQGISPLKSCIPCCCKPSQVENISRYVLILISNTYCQKATQI